MSETHKGKVFPHMFRKRLDMMGNKYRLLGKGNYKHGLSHTPEMRVIYENNRRALKYASKERLSLHDWKIVKAEYYYRCACCKKQVKLTIDHIIPLSKGGSDEKNNIQPLCMKCNRNKFLSITKY